MKLILWLGLIFGVIGQYAKVGVCHPNLRGERKSFHDLNKQERTSLFNAFKKLRRSEWWARFRETSLKMQLRTGTFLEFNRAMLFRLEQELKKFKVMLPYWESSKYSQNPAWDPVFSEENFGGDSSCRYGSCIKRKDISSKTFASREEIELLYLTEKEQWEFGRRIEYGVFPTVTNALYKNFAIASQDPLYFLHLAYVDKLWNDWQKRNFQATQETTTNLRVWNIEHAKVMDPMSHLCYFYREKVHTWEPHLSPAKVFILHGIKGINLPAIDKKPKIKGSLANYLYSNTAAPASSDKKDLCNLRPPSPVASTHIQKLGYNVAMFRAIERQGIRLITQLNRQKNYVPKSALTMFFKNPIIVKCKNPAYNLAKSKKLKLSSKPIRKLIRKE